MRRNAPALIDPKQAVLSRTDRRLGIAEPVDIMARLDQLERQLAAQNRRSTA